MGFEKVKPTNFRLSENRNLSSGQLARLLFKGGRADQLRRGLLHRQGGGGEVLLTVLCWSLGRVGGSRNAENGSSMKFPYSHLR